MWPGEWGSRNVRSFISIGTTWTAKAYDTNWDDIKYHTFQTNFDGMILGHLTKCLLFGSLRASLTKHSILCQRYRPKGS